MTSLRSTISILFLAGITACHGTRSVTLNVNPDPSTRPTAVEIRTRSGPRFTVYGPEVRNDSVFGWFDEARTKPAALPVSDIESARTRSFSGGKTAGLVVGIMAATLLALFIIAMSTVVVVD